MTKMSVFVILVVYIVICCNEPAAAQSEDENCDDIGITCEINETCCSKYCNDGQCSYIQADSPSKRGVLGSGHKSKSKSHGHSKGKRGSDHEETPNP